MVTTYILACQHLETYQMKEVIDLYAKLLIGTFSFIGPSFTLLISLFYNAFQQSQNRHQQKIKNLQLATTQNLSGGGSAFQEQIRQTNNEISKLIKQNQKEIQLLNPKRQVRRIFTSLFTSIALVGFYYYEDSQLLTLNHQKIRIFSLCLSNVCFVYCIRVLWQIFCTIITIKTEEKTSTGEVFLKRARE